MLFVAEHYNPLDRFICLLLGVFCAWSITDGWFTGAIGLKFATVRRSEWPPLFWFAMLAHLVGGITLFIAAITGTIP